ncbi:MAG: DUF4188 domain-containing protein [Caulobacterales bacterium]
MSKIFRGRYTARIDEPFILFVIGMRVNSFWKIWEWAPVFAAMPKMLNELYSNPSSGFLGAQMFLTLRQPVLMQYWRDFDALLAYAHDQSGAHFPAWAEFNRKAGRSGSVGVWHESYRIEKGAAESIYSNMPLWGMAKALNAEHVLAEGRLAAAKDRMNS